MIAIEFFIVVACNTPFQRMPQHFGFKLPERMRRSQTPVSFFQNSLIIAAAATPPKTLQRVTPPLGFVRIS